jgi:hypothetical protein
MSAVVDSLREAECRRSQSLCRTIRHRDDSEIIAEVIAGAEALSTSLRAWRTEPPHTSVVAAARSTVTGLQRLLAELAATQAGRS